jgi:hypothetical protein
MARELRKESIRELKKYLLKKTIYRKYFLDFRTFAKHIIIRSTRRYYIIYRKKRYSED